MRSATLIFKSFIDVSLCSVDAAHMHRRDFDDQMCILSPSLECAKHMSIVKFNSTSRIFSDLDSTFSTPRPAVPSFEISVGERVPHMRDLTSG